MTPKKSNNHCRFSILFFEKINNLIEMNISTKKCLIFIYYCLNNLLNKKVNKNMLYYSTLIKETFFNEKCKYNSLINYNSDELNLPEKNQIGKIIYYTFIKNKIVPYNKNIIGKEMDIETIYRTSFKKNLNNILINKLNININCFTLNDCVKNVKEYIISFI